MAHNVYKWNMNVVEMGIFFLLSQSCIIYNVIMWLDGNYNAEFIENLASENEVCHVFHMKFIN